ncbi:coenzyme F420-0:L-glutamate ligase [Candidatus Woesebacteria bacterium]|nr:coenzyme F420-0:L-glutamate ligase [Candidatus Woesebacteria bacterium]
MQVTPFSTPIVKANDDLWQLLRQVFSLSPLQEKSVVVVTSKVVAFCEGRVVPNSGSRTEKEALVRQEAEHYTDPHSSKYQLMLTVKHQVLAVNAGIDESNANEQYVLLPGDPYASAAEIWKWLRKEYKLKDVGVIISDSRTFPLKWGTIGTCLAHAGFSAINNMIGKPDLFGRPLHLTQVNVAEALAVAAVLEMGEAAEAQPVAVITDASMVVFQDHPPTQQEIKDMYIALEDDAYAPILTRADWKKGGSS